MSEDEALMLALSLSLEEPGPPKQKEELKTEIEPEVVVEKTINNKLVQIKMGDITLEKVDIIVNAANQSLDHSSGVAAAIVKRGGEIIQNECSKHVKQTGKLKDGELFVSSGGKLACVGPIWTNMDKTEEDLLEKSIHNCLAQATKLSCKSISLPAISSGIFGFPKEKCAKILIKTVIQFLESNETKLNQVNFTIIDEETVEVFIEQFNRILSKEQDIFKKVPLNLNEPETIYEIKGAKPSLIQIKYGDICLEKSEAIINFTNSHLTNENQISSSIIKRGGGNEVQELCNNHILKMGELEERTVFVTPGGNSFSYIFHIVCPVWNDGFTFEELNLIESIKKCLQLAEELVIKSISIPIITKNDFGFPKDKSVKSILAAVDLFYQDLMFYHLQSVKFISANKNTVELLEKEIKIRFTNNEDEDMEESIEETKTKLDLQEIAKIHIEEPEKEVILEPETPNVLEDTLGLFD